MRGLILGLGNIAQEGHLPAWQKRQDFEIVAGVDTSAAQRSRFSQRVPGAKVLESLALARDLNIEFADICTPPFLHFTNVRDALNANLHVLCEKPLVLTEKEFAELENLAKQRDRVLMSVHNWKYAPLCRKVSEILEQGLIGLPERVEYFVLRDRPAAVAGLGSGSNNWRTDPKKSGGGILVDHGWHAFYLVLEWMGLVPLTVRAVLENRQYEDLPVEDTAKITLEFPGAKSAEVFLTWASRVRKNCGMVQGSKGVLRIEDSFLTVQELGANGPPERYDFAAPLSEGSHHPEWFDLVIEEFSKELSQSEMRGRNLAMAQSCLKIIERAKDSNSKLSALPF